MKNNGKTILTPNSDGSTTVQRKKDGQLIGKLPSSKDRKAPTPSKARKSSGGIKSLYARGECPDCFLKIPNSATSGDECKNCGHVFYDNN